MHKLLHLEVVYDTLFIVDCNLPSREKLTAELHPTEVRSPTALTLPP